MMEVSSMAGKSLRNVWANNTKYLKLKSVVW